MGNGIRRSESDCGNPDNYYGLLRKPVFASRLAMTRLNAALLSAIYILYFIFYNFSIAIKYFIKSTASSSSVTASSILKPALFVLTSPLITHFVPSAAPKSRAMLLI